MWFLYILFNSFSFSHASPVFESVRAGESYELSSSLAGCFGDDIQPPASEDSETYPSIWDRHQLEWNMTHSFSRVLEPGPYHALDVQESYITVDTSSIWETGPSESEVHLASNLKV